MAKLTSIIIKLDHIKAGLTFTIDGKENTLFDEGDEAKERYEARYQLLEGCYYDYAFSDVNYTLDDVGENIVRNHRSRPSLGTLAPNIYTGTLVLPISEKGIGKGNISFEIRAVKTGSRKDYENMLEYITEKCTDLLLQSNAPTSHRFEKDFTKEPKSLYQKFAFIKSIIGSTEFSEAIHRITTSPVTQWTQISETKDIRQARRFTNTNTKEFAKSTNRIHLQENHSLYNRPFTSLPQKINSVQKTDSVDTPENRFIKHVLETFLVFCVEVNKKAKEGTRLYGESILLIQSLESYLHHALFKDVARPTTLKLNSPVLQRKEGYREVLRVWLMFDLAAKLIWQGGEDVYSGNKKDVATLYEYWLFFQLLELLQNIFKINPNHISKLIQSSPNGLNLQLKQGYETALEGVYDAGPRKLNIRFTYNRTFSGKKEYPYAGSWTLPFRPDYTLSFWPHGILEDEAEIQELIVHVHFDAKYKVANLLEMAEDWEKELTEEKKENRKGKYKHADLLKMHAYKDAIRRTAGAYVLYPGGKPLEQKGFHELIPGLGAFPLSPSNKERDVNELKAFIQKIVQHFIHQSSQREKQAYRTYDIHKNTPDSTNIVKEPLPQNYNQNRGFFPDETIVMVGYYNSQEQYDWIVKNNLYNFRTGTGNGSLLLNKDTVSASYILLHTSNDKTSSRLFKIVNKGLRVFSKNDLLKKGYPIPSQEYYLVVDIQPLNEVEFLNKQWDFKKLKNYAKGNASAYPYTASLAELMNHIIK